MHDERIEKKIDSINNRLIRVETKLDVSLCRVDKLERNQSWTVKSIIAAFLASLWALIAGR